MAIEVLVFEVEGRSYGVPALDVVEVVRAATLSPLPQRSETVEGLLNLRGRVLPVFDIRRMFQLPAREITHTDHLVVVQKDGRSGALRVDQALDLVQLQFEDEPATEPSESRKDVVAAIGRLQEGIVHVLDTSRLLATDEEVLSLVEHSVTEVSR
jgi:purine-binding chemotaxis protein CheW